LRNVALTPSVAVPALSRHEPYAEHLDELSAEVATYRHGRVPAELRRRHIMAVAFGLFAERGFRDTSMDELAARAGVSKPVIYGLVGDKERLFRTCVEAAAGELATRVRSAMHGERRPEGAVRAGARAFFAFVAEAGRGWDRLLVNEGGPISEELSAARRRQADVVAELLGELLDGMRPGAGDGDGDGTTGPPVDRVQVEALAHAMNGACEALVVWWRRHPERTVDDLAEVATRLLAPGVLGVAARPLDGAWAGPTAPGGAG
jgi:AcrR family transcriptional regulator